MAKIAIPSTAHLWVVQPDKRNKGYTYEEAKAALGEDVFDKIEGKGKHEQKRMTLCNKHEHPCIGSMGSPEVFRYGYFEWREGKPFPVPVVTAEDFGRTEIRHKVSFKNMEAVWTEEFQNG